MQIENKKYYYTNDDYLINGYIFRSDKYPKMYIKVNLGYFNSPDAKGFKEKEIFIISGGTDDVRYESISLDMQRNSLAVINNPKLPIDEYPEVKEIIEEMKNLFIEAVTWLKEKGYKIHNLTFFDSGRGLAKIDTFSQLYSDLQDDLKELRAKRETEIDFSNV